jgi:hypothetical protein
MYPIDLIIGLIEPNDKNKFVYDEKRRISLCILDKILYDIYQLNINELI